MIESFCPLSGAGADIEIALPGECADLHRGIAAQHELAPVGLDRNTQDEACIAGIISQRIIDDLGEGRSWRRIPRAKGRCCRKASSACGSDAASALSRSASG